MKIAIVGSNGYIAKFLLKQFEKDINISEILKIDQSGQYDEYLNLELANAFDYGQLEDVDFLIYTAAVSKPDACASDFVRCWRVNVEGTMYFIREAINRGCRVLFFSSDAVFGDGPGEIYTEESETKAFTPYGKMKKAVEDEFRGFPYFKAIRLSYVVSARDRFISYCLSCIERNEEADIFHPFYRNCISITDVVNVVSWFAYHFDEYEPQFLNVAGRELVSRVRIADELNRVLDGKLKYIISRPDKKFFKNRPNITQMNSLYLQKYGILEDSSFSEKIQKELEVLKY